MKTNSTHAYQKAYNKGMRLHVFWNKEKRAVAALGRAAYQMYTPRNVELMNQVLGPDCNWEWITDDERQRRQEAMRKEEKDAGSKKRV